MHYLHKLQRSKGGYARGVLRVYRADSTLGEALDDGCVQGCFGLIELFESFFFQFPQFAFVRRSPPSVKGGHSNRGSCTDDCRVKCSARRWRSGRGHVFWVCVPVYVACNQAVGPCRIQSRAKFLQRVVQIDFPLWVSNSVVERSV